MLVKTIFKPSPDLMKENVEEFGMEHDTQNQDLENPNQVAFKVYDYGGNIAVGLHRVLIRLGFAHKSTFRPGRSWHKNYEQANGDWAQVARSGCTTSLVFHGRLEEKE